MSLTSDKNSVACLQRLCSACKDSEVPFSLEILKDEPLSYYQWITEQEELFVRGKKKMTKRVMKKKMESSTTICVDLLKDTLLKYMKYEAIFIHQFRQIDRLKKRLPPDKILIYCDFSENWASK